MSKKTQTAAGGLKLNVKRTALIGFAFFGICLLWQVYDSWCPPLLTDIFVRWFQSEGEEVNDLTVQWLVGIVMACDNLAALILLPIFGALSDKTKTPIGKRMPFILVGTLVAAVAFPFIPMFFHNNKVAGMIIMMAIVLVFMMMYRNPAVSLMPDITPKPLRAKANGIINIMGYFGGAFATVLGLLFVVSDYIKTPEGSRNVWLIEIPFIVASVLMVISAFVLFLTVKENKLAEELKDEMDEGEKQAAIADAIDDDKPMTKANKIMLFAILGAEFLWFMSDNAVGTYLTNYVIYGLESASSNATVLVIAGGVASVAGFAVAGTIAEKIGRKWTVSIGLFISVAALVLMCFAGKQSGTYESNGIIYHDFPVLLYVVWAIKGFGMALVHNCSFPMVVELSSSKNIGKFTGFYYSASMAAQTITPILLGLIFVTTQKWTALPVYATVMLALSAVVFTLLVKNIKAVKVENKKGLEALGDDD